MISEIDIKDMAEQPAQTDWEAVAADHAMTIALMKVQLEGLPGKEQFPWFKDEIPAAYMYDRARYGPTDLRGQQWLPELSRLKPYMGDGRVRGLRPLYTHPIPQTWVGLTDEEILIMSRYDLEYAALIGEVQRKLKEKNT